MGARAGIHCCVKQAILTAALAILMPSLASAQSEVVAEKVPDAAIASAVQAVADLGKSVVQGRYRVALDRMNPKEKAQLAKQKGGIEAVEKKLEGVADEMVRQGVRIISCKPQGKPVAYGVEPEDVIEEVDGKKVNLVKYSQWLVLVPTITRFEVLHRVEGQPAKWIEIEEVSFQVAVSDRDKADWTFINGAGLSVARLRNLYLTLPATIEFPPVQRRHIQN